MKVILFRGQFLLILLLCLAVKNLSAQQQIPVIKVGTAIEYKFFLYGQTVPMKLTVKSVQDSVLLDWYIRGATGSYLIAAAGVEKGTKINFVQPAWKEVLRLAPDETFAIISRSAFAALQRDKQFVYNQTTYQLKDKKAYQLGDKKVKVYHVVGKEEAAELWILDNPTCPLICELQNNPLGINFKAIAIN